MRQPTESALARRLKTVAQRYTQSEIARRTGTWVSNVHHYLNGTRVPAGFLSALVEKCGVNAQWLLTGEGPPYAADLAPESGHFAADVHKLSRALDAASKLRLGELFTQKRTRVLAEINEALEAHEAAQARVAALVDGPMQDLRDRYIAAMAEHDKGDKSALARARGFLDVMKKLLRLTDNRVREIEVVGCESRLAVYESRFEDALKGDRRSFLMSFSVLGPAMPSFHGHAESCAASLARNGFFREARVVLRTALPLARQVGNDPPQSAFCDVFACYCAAQSGEIAGQRAEAERALAKPGAREAVAMYVAMPMVLEIGLMDGTIDFATAFEFGPNALTRRRALYAWASWSEDPAQLKKLLREKPRGLMPMQTYAERICERWKRIGETVYRAAWGRETGLWREVLQWNDRAYTCSDERERAFKAIRACQAARLCGEHAKAKELLLDAQAALGALPPGMDVFILERATHYRNALVLGDGPKGSTRARNLRAQAQRWFREHAARGYACFAGFGV